jgi:flagellar basal body rod protein FlgG
LKKGFLERSNVDLSAELVALQVLESKRAALLQVMRSYGIEMP